jgi:hypothetical protein
MTLSFPGGAPDGFQIKFRRPVEHPARQLGVSIERKGICPPAGGKLVRHLSAADF